MKRFLKTILYIVLALLAVLLIAFIVFKIYYGVQYRKAYVQLSEVKTLTENGITFRDLNKNGKLDIYEDSRANVEDRVTELLKQMNLEEKAGMMWHPSIGVGSKGEVTTSPGLMSFNSNYDLIVNQKINTFNLFFIPSSKMLATWYNAVQLVASQTRLGIPLSISSDPRHGINNFLDSDLLKSDFSKWPEPIGLAATGDSMLVNEFAKIANQEYRAVGIRIALHPMADLATEPRWARMNGTFGEDAQLSSKLIAAYILGFQGDSLGTESVACMTKHWPGGGPLENGEDSHFSYGKNQVYPGENFDYFLIPFQAAFKANTAMIMPYYSVPYNQTSENVGMSFNKEIITDLLREKYGYDGIVCSDWNILEGISIFGFTIVEAKNWGVEQLTIKERIVKAIDAGIDQFGGNNFPNELVELVKEGKITEDRIDESVRRILRAKFKMGLFDNPFVDVNQVEEIVGNPDALAKGKLAQRKSIVLLKNTINANSSFALPLNSKAKIYIENIDKSIASNYGNVVESLDEADIAILRIQTPYEKRTGDLVERMFHQGELDFKEPELGRILDIMNKKPTIVCIYLDRAAVIPEIADKAMGLLADFGAEDDAVLDIVFGKFNPTAKLPFELPSSMHAVVKQKEDMPYDSENPLFPFGWGLSY
jgi:beta-glucosidase